MKVCGNCRLGKDYAEFSKNSGAKDGLQHWCKTCYSEYLKPYARHYTRYYSKGNLVRQRQAAIVAYGGKCVCCGEGQYEFLAFDHINNGRGNPPNRERTYTMLRRLRDAGWPKDEIQLLCHNCNLAKGFYGKCPHEKK